MFRFLLNKLKQKKWMVASLLIGNILLIAIVVSFPMYKQAARDRMLSDEFTSYLKLSHKNPGIYECNITRKKENLDGFYKLRDTMVNDEDILGAPIYTTVEYLKQKQVQGVYSVERDGNKEVAAQIATISQLEDKAKLISGRMFEQNSEVVEAVVSENTFVEMNLVVGDEITLKRTKDVNGKDVVVRIVGVFTCEDTTDPYWVLSPSSFKSDLFVSKDVFERIFMEANPEYVVLAKWYKVLNTGDMTAEEAARLKKGTDKLNDIVNSSDGHVTDPLYYSVLESYEKKANSVVNSLMILQIPMLVLLVAFLFMISGQMLSMEQNEISLFKSRGAGKLQIFNIYLLQSVILTFASFVVAMPLGYLLCRMLGSANAFLSFEGGKSLRIRLGAEVWLYGLGSVALSILVQVIPAIRRSSLSIVSAKQKKHSSTKKWWQKVYLDVIMLLVALYGFYSFSGRKEEITLKVLAGEAMDPLLYLSSSLFILGAGLVILRFWPMFVKLVFTSGKKKWKPEKYASFLQVIRTGHKQLFMMEFLILTVALGIFNATVARTILYNAEQNETYSLGADLIVSQNWKSNYAQYIYGQAAELIYTEADSTGFMNIEDIDSVTHVLSGKAVSGTGITASRGGNNSYSNLYFMGVVTDEFGRMVKDNGGNPYPLKDYLNVLSTNPNAVIVSENYKTVLGLKIGDRVKFTYADKKAESWKVDFEGVIYGFFSEFPTYSPKENTLLSDGSAKEVDNYMIVGNLGGMMKQLGTIPYDLWFSLDSNGEKAVFDYISEHNIQMNDYKSLDENLNNIYYDPLFQGTNGILTLSFIVILVLCSVGFLIYWILSIRERELLFGVFRAMGMSKQGILSMLINEQMFSTLICIIAGTGIGFLASALFVPIIQLTYTAGNQVLVTPLVTWPSDMVRLFVVILGVIMACMYVLAKIVFSMKITNALKLGED